MISHNGFEQVWQHTKGISFYRHIIMTCEMADGFLPLIMQCPGFCPQLSTWQLKCMYTKRLSTESLCTLAPILTSSFMSFDTDSRIQQWSGGIDYTFSAQHNPSLFLDKQWVDGDKRMKSSVCINAIQINLTEFI